MKRLLVLQDGRAGLVQADFKKGPGTDRVFGLTLAFQGRRQAGLRRLLLFSGRKKTVIELVNGKNDIIFRLPGLGLRHILVGPRNLGGIVDFDKLRQRLT